MLRNEKHKMLCVSMCIIFIIQALNLRHPWLMKPISSDMNERWIARPNQIKGRSPNGVGLSQRNPILCEPPMVKDVTWSHGQSSGVLLYSVHHVATGMYYDVLWDAQTLIVQVCLREKVRKMEYFFISECFFILKCLKLPCNKECL
jgi:hypothetical protein